MKKILITIFILAFAGFTALSAQQPGVTVSDMKIEVAPGGNADITFMVAASKKSFASRYALCYIPVIFNDGQSLELPAILIQGKRAAVTDRRDRLAQRSGIDADKTYVMSLGSEIKYEASVPYQPWMVGARLEFRITTLGCEAVATLPAQTVASGLFIGDTTRVIRVIEPMDLPKTVADTQAEQFSFVAHISEFDKAREDIVEGETFDDNMLLHLGKAVGKEKQAYVEKFVERNKPGSLIIYYRVNKSNIDTGYMDNSLRLAQLIDAVNKIQNSEDSNVHRVVIAGFASPEGTPNHNDMLAWKRAQTVKGYIQERTGLSEEKIRVFNGSEDWLGLRQKVEGSTGLSAREKEQVLKIIDTVPREEGSAKDGRLGELMRLNGGSTYKYLFKNYFPELRNAAYIKVYYENVY